MTDFERIQSLWNQQPDASQSETAMAIMTRAETDSKRLLATHRGTMVTLSATVLVLAGYFWTYGTTSNRTVLVGSLLMVVSLLLRIGVEYVSYRRFARIKLNTDLRTCLEQISAFHRIRQQIQFVVTPLSFGSYVWGFILLLPYIKAGVSEGFYLYIIFSGTLFLLLIGVVIYRQIRGEMRLLAQLKASYATLLEN